MFTAVRTMFTSEVTKRAVASCCIAIVTLVTGLGQSLHQLAGIEHGCACASATSVSSDSHCCQSSACPFDSAHSDSDSCDDDSRSCSKSADCCSSASYFLILATVLSSIPTWNASRTSSAEKQLLQGVPLPRLPSQSIRRAVLPSGLEPVLTVWILTRLRVQVAQFTHAVCDSCRFRGWMALFFTPDASRCPAD